MYVNFINPFYVTSDIQILAQQIKNTVQEAVDDMNDENINQLSILVDTLTLMLEVPSYSQELIQNSNILSLLELANIKLTKDNDLEQKILIFQNQLSQQNHLQSYWIKQQAETQIIEHNILDLIVADNKKLFQILIRMLRILLLHFESNKQQAPDIFYFYKKNDRYSQQLWEQAIAKLMEFMLDENTEQEYKYRIIDIFIFLNREDQLMNKMLLSANIIPELVKLSPTYTKRCLLLIRDLIDKQENPSANLDIEVTGQTLFNIIKLDKHNTQINSLVSQILQKINYKPQKQERQQIISQENAQEYVDNICFQVLSNKQEYDEQEIIQMLEIIVKNQDLQEDVILSIFFLFETYMKQIVQKIKNQICVQAYKLLIRTQHEKVILQGLQLCYILHSEYKIQVQEQKLKIIVENNINNNQIMRLVDKILQLKRRVKKRLEDETIVIQEEDISKLTDRQLRHTIVMKQIQQQVINPQQPEEPPNRFSMMTSMALEEEDEVELLLKESLRRANYITCIESLHYILQLQQDYNEECHGYLDLIIQIYLLYPTSSQVINYAKDIFSRIFIQTLIESTIQEVNQNILDIKILRRFTAVSLLIQEQDIFINIISQLVINKMDQDQLYLSLIMIKNQKINQQIINSFLLDYFNSHQPPLKLKAIQYFLNINFDPQLSLKQIDESISQIQEEYEQNQFYNTLIVLQLINHHKKDKLFLLQNQLLQKFLTVQEFIIIYYTTHIVVEHILLQSLQIFEELSMDNLVLEQLNYKVYLGQLQQIIAFGKDNQVSPQILKIILNTFNQQFQKKQICDYYDNQFIDDNSLAYVTLNRDQDQDIILSAIQIFEKLIHSNNKRRFNYLKQLLEDLLIDDLLIDIKQDILNLLDKFKVKEVKHDQGRTSQISQAIIIQQVEKEVIHIEKEQQIQQVQREEKHEIKEQQKEVEKVEVVIEKQQQNNTPPQNQEVQEVQEVVIINQQDKQSEQIQDVQEILIVNKIIEKNEQIQACPDNQDEEQLNKQQQQILVVEQNEILIIEKEEKVFQNEPPQQQNNVEKQNDEQQYNNIRQDKFIQDTVEEIIVIKEVDKIKKPKKTVQSFQEDIVQNEIQQEQQANQLQARQQQITSQENTDSIQNIEHIAILLKGITVENQQNTLSLILKDINKFIYDEDTAIKAHQLKITQNLINLEGSEIQLRLLDKIFKFTQSSLSCENDFDLSKLQLQASNYLLRIVKNTSHLKHQQTIMIGQQKIKVLIENYQKLDDFKLYFKCLDAYCTNSQTAQLYFNLQVHLQVLQFHNKYSEECYQLVGSMCIHKQAQQAYQELIPLILQKLQLANKTLLANSFYALSGLVYCNQTNLFNKDLGKFVTDALNLDDGPIIEAVCSFISNLTYKNDTIKKQLKELGFIELFYQKLFKAPSTLALKQVLRVLGNLSYLYDNAVILQKMEFIKFVDGLAKQKDLTLDLLNIYNNFGAHQLLEAPYVLTVIKIIKRNFSTPKIVANGLETILALVKNHSIFIVQNKITDYLDKLLILYDNNFQIKLLLYRVISNLSVEQSNQGVLQQLLPQLKNSYDVTQYYQKIIQRLQGAASRSSVIAPQMRISNVLTQQGYEFTQFRTDGSHKQAVLKILPTFEIFAAQKIDGAVRDKYRIKTITKYVFNINPLIDYPIYVKQKAFRKEYFFVIEGLFGKERNIIAGMTKTLEAKQSLYEEILSIYHQTQK